MVDEEEYFLKRLVITGNGFDLAHGLPTKYSDFKEYLNCYEKDLGLSRQYLHFTGTSERHQHKSSFYEAISKYIPESVLWSSFESALSLLDDEQLQEDNRCYLLGYGDENWSDSAHHDFQYMINEALAFSSDISYYFSQWIQSIDTRVLTSVSSEIINAESIFLTFNYTDTLESSYGIPEERIVYIHGKALRGERLIVGHHDISLIEEEEVEEFWSDEERELYYQNCAEDVRIIEAKEIIKSYFKRTYKDTASIIQKNQNFFDALNLIDEIYIFGHSLAMTDFEYFLEIKKKVPLLCKWNISYHSEEDYYNVQNFVQKIGIDEYGIFYL